MNSPIARSLFSRGTEQIYTNGAFLSPFKIIVDGREAWLWKVDEFEDDCFVFGEECCPAEKSNTKAGLMS
jgi:hypothetical protein